MVNPMLLPFVVIVCIALWFILSFIFKPLGRFLNWIWTRTTTALGFGDPEDDQNSEEDTEEK